MFDIDQEDIVVTSIWLGEIAPARCASVGHLSVLGGGAGRAIRSDARSCIPTRQPCQASPAGAENSARLIGAGRARLIVYPGAAGSVVAREVGCGRVL